MHEIFLNRYPFYFHDEKLMDRVYTNDDYCNYWFHNSEGNEVYGESKVFPLIEAIIIKCLHPNPKHRPELEWIIYILRGCLEHFY
jgi:hypothetical protein